MSPINHVTNGHASALPAATKLRRYLENPHERKILVCPGVYDGFSARIALSVGFSHLYMTGAGTTASRLGHADLGIATQFDMRTNAEMIATLDPSVPLIADADTGYGGPINIARTVQMYARSGVAGLHIEDQVQSKRCGHLGGKEVVDLESYIIRIRAAVAARKAIGSDIVIMARTDALQVLGYEEAIRRLKAAREAGADVGFLEGISSREMMRMANEELSPWPLLLNMVESSSMPHVSAEEAEEFGFRIIIYSFAALAPAYQAIYDGMMRVKETGRMSHDPKMSPKFLLGIMGLEESMAIDAAAGGKLFVKKV